MTLMLSLLPVLNLGCAITVQGKADRILAESTQAYTHTHTRHVVYF